MGRGTRVDRREQILDAAQELLTDGGFAAVSVMAVASRAGLGASTRRYWFPSQESLSEANARRALSVELRDHRIADPTVPAVDRLSECMSQFLPPVDGGAPAGLGPARAWFTLAQSALGVDATPVGRAMYSGMVEASYAAVHRWLRRLVAEGALIADVPTTALALLTRVDGLMLGLLSPGTPLDQTTAAAILRTDVERLLAAGPAADRTGEAGTGTGTGTTVGSAGGLTSP